MRSALACALLVIALAASPAHSQSGSELNALNRRVIELHRAGKYSEAIPLAERYAEAMKARGPDSPEYATSVSNLARLLEDTNRMGEAEPLYRRTLCPTSTKDFKWNV